MTEEIKEIIEYLKNDNIEKPFGMATIDKKRLLNYITNLQKEKESLKEKLNCKEYFSSTMPENTEFVILTKENYDRQQKDLALENIMLKSRNEKAVEYIKNNTKYFDKEYCSIYGKLCSMPGVNDTRLHVIINDETLLNILEGGDE